MTAQLGKPFFGTFCIPTFFKIIIFTDYLVSWFSNTRIDRVIGFLFGAAVLQSALTLGASCISVFLLGFLPLDLWGHDCTFLGEDFLSALQALLSLLRFLSVWEPWFNEFKHAFVWLAVFLHLGTDLLSSKGNLCPSIQISPVPLKALPVEFASLFSVMVWSCYFQKKYQFQNKADTHN